MKLFFIMPSFRGGGAERVFIDLATKFHEDGHDVELVALSGDGEYKKNISPSLPLNVFGRTRVLFAFLDLIKIFWRNDNAVVISCLTHLNIICALSWIITGKRTKLVVTEHNNYSLEKKHIVGIKKKILNSLTSLTYSQVNKIIAVSIGVKKDLCEALKIDSSRVKVIYNPIDIAKVQHLSSLVEVKLDARSTDSDYQIFAMGRLVPQKRYDILIKAFSEVLLEIPSAKLTIMGDGPLKDELVYLAKSLNISSHISILPFQDNPFKRLVLSDVFVLSSDFEGFGNVIVEALALGCMVVSTDCPSGPSEILEDGKYGVLVHCGSSHDLALGILRVARDGEPISGQVERSKKFDISVAIEQYSQVFKKLIHK